VKQKYSVRIRGISRVILSVLAAGGVALAVGPSAKATPMLFLSDGMGHMMTLGNAAGPISFTGTLGNFQLSLATAAASGEDIMPSLTFSSIAYTGSGTGNLTVLFSNTSFSPFAGIIASQISGQASGNVFYSTFADGSNALFGMSTLLSAPALGGGTSFAETGFASSSLQYPFSITERIVIRESAGGTTSFGTVLFDPPVDGRVVPDSGSTVGLLALALVGLGVIRRKLIAA
jgi:protein with PEP-CTERM/exosortase system signal